MKMSLQGKSLRLHKKHWSRKLLLQKDDDLEQGDAGGVGFLLMVMTLLITCALLLLLQVVVLVVVTWSDSRTMLSPTIFPAVITVAAEEERETRFGLWEAKKDKYY